jgi:hypothetical protein
MEEIGVTPIINPIRGGTDGARLSFMGLPCPNLSTGGVNFHSRFEFISTQSLEKMSELIVKIVENVEEAISYINSHNSKHSECIITNDRNTARLFQTMVDASCVYVNASTRFTDGGEFGFGAELGISTQKLHARGPMGIKVLTTTKYLIDGDGQIR